MAIDVIRAVTALLSTCSRRVSRAARRLRGARQIKALALSRVMPYLGSRRRKRVGEEKRRREKIGGGDDEELRLELDDDEVWRRGIIMGEKCQPLDFSGVIYYDSDGRQLAGVPTTRSPMRSPLPAFLAEEKAWK